MKKCCPKTSKDWRAWLKKHHKHEKDVLLVKFKRHTGKPAPSPQEAMDEAICFGWIDTTAKRLDKDRYQIKFVKRGPKARWSKATQKYARRLIKEGKMTPAGLKAYKEGLKRPVIDHGLPRNPETPLVLKKALAKNQKAKNIFAGLAPSYKRYAIYWIEKAKLPETKQRRVREVIRRIVKNKRPF